MVLETKKRNKFVVKRDPQKIIKSLHDTTLNKKIIIYAIYFLSSKFTTIYTAHFDLLISSKKAFLTQLPWVGRAPFLYWTVQYLFSIIPIKTAHLIFHLFLYTI